jgi:UDP-N-acetylglucosamine acyltransferase
MSDPGLTDIDPAAHVSPEATIGEGVRIGPGAVVEAGARIGDGTVVLANAVVTAFATIGKNCRIHQGACVGGDPQDLSFAGGDTRVEVGDGTTIREFATVHRATKPGAATTVGRDCYLMVNSHLAHDCVVGDKVVICNAALVAGHVTIGDRAFISGNTVIHQFSRVGTLAMLGGLSGIGLDLGPYLTAVRRNEVASINVVGMRRAGFDADARRRVQTAYRELFSASTLAAGIVAVRALGVDHPEIRAIVSFYDVRSKRGFCRPPSGHALGDSAEE